MSLHRILAENQKALLESKIQVGNEIPIIPTRGCGDCDDARNSSTFAYLYQVCSAFDFYH